MGLKIHDDWKWITTHCWSFRFLILAAVLTGAEASLPLLVDHSPVPRHILAAVLFLVVAGALVARLIVQERPPQLFDAPAPHIVPPTLIVGTTSDGKTVTGVTTSTLTQPISVPVSAPVTVAAPQPALPAAPVVASAPGAPAVVAAPEPAPVAAPTQAADMVPLLMAATVLNTATTVANAAAVTQAAAQ